MKFVVYRVENAKIIRESTGEWRKSMRIILINSIELGYIINGAVDISAMLYDQVNTPTMLTTTVNNRASFL